MQSKDLNHYMGLHYKIELIPEADGSWGAVIPELLGCVGGGDTITEALEMLEDAKRGWFESALKHGDPIPEPSFADVTA
jgi:predicted RNase H-like HicB family nuclease